MVRELLDHTDDGFRTWFLDPAARRRALVGNMRRLTAELQAEPGDPGDPLGRTASVIYLLGADADGSVPDDVFAEFATVVVQAVADRGAGREFHRHDLILQAIDAAIERVRAAGRSATDLLLARADYLSCAANDCPERLATLRTAESEATGEELMRVRHALIGYLTGVSRYREAIALCDDSATAAESMGDTGVRWRAAFLARRGVARYTTLNNPDVARADLLAAISSLDGATDEDSAEHRSSALHYLGRILLDEGDVAGSLEHFLAAQEARKPLPFQSGAFAYFHIRMAETLLGAHAFKDADDHLTEARSYLDRIGDSGSTTVCYHYALANAHALRGETADALALLNRCATDAKACRFARGRLLALTRLIPLHLQQRNPLAATATLFRTVPLLFDGELRRNSLLAIVARLRGYTRHVVHPYGSDAPGGSCSSALRCPCPLHHREAGERRVPLDGNCRPRVTTTRPASAHQ